MDVAVTFPSDTRSSPNSSQRLVIALNMKFIDPLIARVFDGTIRKGFPRIGFVGAEY